MNINIKTKNDINRRAVNFMLLHINQFNSVIKNITISMRYKSVFRSQIYSQKWLKKVKTILNIIAKC